MDCTTILASTFVIISTVVSSIFIIFLKTMLPFTEVGDSSFICHFLNFLVRWGTLRSTCVSGASNRVTDLCFFAPQANLILKFRAIKDVKTFDIDLIRPFKVTRTCFLFKVVFTNRFLLIYCCSFNSGKFSSLVMGLNNLCSIILSYFDRKLHYTWNFLLHVMFVSRGR